MRLNRNLTPFSAGTSTWSSSSSYLARVNLVAIMLASGRKRRADWANSSFSRSRSHSVMWPPSRSSTTSTNHSRSFDTSGVYTWHSLSRQNSMHSRLLLSSVRVGVCVCVCVCVPRWWSGEKQIEINLPFFSPSYRPQKSHPVKYSATLKLMTLTYFLKVKDSNHTNTHYVISLLYF